MRRTNYIGFLLAMLGAVALHVNAQPPERPPQRERGQFNPGPGGPGGRPIPPVMAALDGDGNGELSDKEIENASKALTTLDKNKDGKLTEDELRPNFGGRGGPDGREGEGAGGRGPNPEEMFARMDADKDGKLGKDEIPEERREFVLRADSDKDGTVSKDEFAKMFQDLRNRGGSRPGGPGGFGPPGGGAFGPPSPEAFVERAMQFDADKDEKLSKEELGKFAEQLGRAFGGGRDGADRGGERRGDRGGERDRPERPKRPE